MKFRIIKLIDRNHNKFIALELQRFMALDGEENSSECWRLIKEIEYEGPQSIGQLKQCATQYKESLNWLSDDYINEEFEI